MDFIWLVPVSGLLAVLVAAFLAWDVIRRDQGPQEMRAVAAKIYEGATAFLNRQYRTIAVLAVVGAIAIAALLGVIRTSQESPEAGLNLAWRTGVAFIFGAFCSGLAGFIGMIIAVRANLRTAAAARNSLGEAMTIALRGGAVSGLLVVALSLLGVFFLFELYGGVSNQIDGVPVAPSLDRRLRLRGLLRGPLRPARRRHLHQGRRRRRRPGGQGGGGHPGGRPAQPGRDRRPRGRQRGRLRRARAPTSSSPPPPRTSGP